MAIPMTPPAGAADFLARHGWADAVIEPLAGDASFRRYFRVRRSGPPAPGRRATAVLMDAPPPAEDVRPFMAVAGELRARGLAAPKLLGADEGAGLLLLQDFGDARLTTVLVADPTREAELYARATDVLIELSYAEPPAGLRRYDWAEYARELALFADWYLPAAGIDADRDAFLAAWEPLLAGDPAFPDAFVLRDFHADNLMVRAGRDGLAMLGLLDFQDALTGSPAYDLVSLLEDARRDVSPHVAADMRARFVEGAGVGDADAFAAEYALMGAQRNVKILGIFARLWRRDGKPAYLAHMPRVWGHLERDLAHPALAGPAVWFATNVPLAARGSALMAAA